MAVSFVPIKPSPAFEPASLRQMETTRCGQLPDAALIEALPVSGDQPEDEDTILQRRLDDRRELT